MTQAKDNENIGSSINTNQLGNFTSDFFNNAYSDNSSDMSLQNSNMKSQMSQNSFLIAQIKQQSVEKIVNLTNIMVIQHYFKQIYRRGLSRYRKNANNQQNSIKILCRISLMIKLKKIKVLRDALKDIRRYPQMSLLQVVKDGANKQIRSIKNQSLPITLAVQFIKQQKSRRFNNKQIQSQEHISTQTTLGEQCQKQEKLIKQAKAIVINSKLNYKNNHIEQKLSYKMEGIIDLHENSLHLNQQNPRSLLCLLPDQFNKIQNIYFQDKIDDIQALISVKNKIMKKKDSKNQTTFIPPTSQRLIIKFKKMRKNSSPNYNTLKSNSSQKSIAQKKYNKNKQDGSHSKSIKSHKLPKYFKHEEYKDCNQPQRSQYYAGINRSPSAHISEFKGNKRARSMFQNYQDNYSSNNKSQQCLIKNYPKYESKNNLMKRTDKSKKNLAEKIKTLNIINENYYKTKVQQKKIHHKESKSNKHILGKSKGSQKQLLKFKQEKIRETKCQRRRSATQQKNKKNRQKKKKTKKGINYGTSENFMKKI